MPKIWIDNKFYFIETEVEAKIEQLKEQIKMLKTHIEQLEYQEICEDCSAKTELSESLTGCKAKERIEELEGKPKELVFGDGSILISPFECRGITGIAFSTRLGTGKINEKHPTIKAGNTLNIEDYDIIFSFKNKESLKVLKWAVKRALKG